MGATLQDRGEKTDWVGVREPHVGATRGGRSLPSRKGGEEDPAELKGESLDPRVPVPLGEAGETPASGRLALPSLSFPCPGGGDRARSLGRDRAGRVPALAAAAPPALFTPARGGAAAGPAPLAPTRGPRWPLGPGGLGAAPRLPFLPWVVHLWVPGPCVRLVCSSSRMTPLPTHLSASPFLWPLHLRCRDFFNTDTFHPRLPSQSASLSPPNPMSLFPCVSAPSLPCVSPASPCVGLPVPVCLLPLSRRLAVLLVSPCLCGLSISPSDRSCPSFLLPPYLPPLLPSTPLRHPSFGVC